jgi:uncharacterized protein YdeI (YjbR/CyaY-like superfamily)
MANKDPRIDAYISKVAPFAQPILSHLRDVVHAACPNVEETWKWSFPHFDYKGSILCSMAAFKQHATFGFFKASLMDDPHGILKTIGKTAMGNLGQIKDIRELPNDKILKEYIRQAMKLNEAGVKVSKPKTEKVKEPDTPEYFAKALKKNKAANTAFENFTPGKKKEYIEWLEGAKTEATREKRLVTAIEYISEGKGLNWKYQKG